MNITEIFTTPLILTMFLGALLIGILISVSASLLGVTLVLKKYSMLGDGLAHIGFGAMAVAAICEKLFSDAMGDNGKYSQLISVPIVIAAAILILKIGESDSLKGDSAIALVSTSALALGYIIYGFATGQTSDVCASMFGSAALLSPSDTDILTTAVLAAIVITVFILYYNRIFAITFDETFSKASGIKTDRLKTVIAVLTALTVVMGMKMLGTVMISGLIVFPTLSAMKTARSFKGVVAGSVLISTICCIVGIILAFTVRNLPIGPSVVLVNLIVYVSLTVVTNIKK